MLTIEKLDTNNKDHVRRFTRLPFRLYAGHPQWVPSLLIDSETQLNRKKHPFFEHSAVDFFLAVADGRDVGRIAAIENKPFNEYHGARKAQFYFFDSEDEQEIADKLFERVFEWSYARGLDHVVGPKGISPFDGYGIQTEGFEHRQMMNMMNYNYSYYPQLVEAAGFSREVDFVSCYVETSTFQLPERVHTIAERVQKRGALRVLKLESKKDLRKVASQVGQAYNKAFVNNWEYYPLSEREVQFVVDTLMQVIVPRLAKLIVHEEQVVGFVLGFPDISAAMQRIKGRLLPFGIIDLLLEMRRTDWISLNGAGILPEFQGRGGNALLYSEMVKTLGDFQFKHAELTQVANTAVQMRNDLKNLNAKEYKNHRVYSRDI
jgi:hypothetical protein